VAFQHTTGMNRMMSNFTETLAADGLNNT